MKTALVSVILFFTALQFVFAQTPTIGLYPATTIATAGGQATITPSVAPANAVSMTAYTNVDFKGLLSVNPLTGAVMATNAQPAGTYTITVKAFNGTAIATTTFPLTVNNPNCANGLFMDTHGNNGAAVEANPTSVAVGDFNGDGKQDFVAAGESCNCLTVYLNNIGSLTAASSVSVGSKPQSVAIADFNGDGKQDLAAANFLSNTVSIRLGNGAGGFTGTLNVVVGVKPIAVATGDFNNDGNADFAAVNYNSNSVSIRLGNGAGGFTTVPDISVGSLPHFIAVADFNNDGYTDFVVPNYSSGSNTVSVRLGNGAGNFTLAADVPVGNRPISIATGDFNGDGKADFVTANAYANTASVRLGDGSGNFSGTVNVSVGYSPNAVVAADFNGDSKLDFATANYDSRSVSIRLNNGSGDFLLQPDIPVGYSYITNGAPGAIATGDFDNDGWLDWVVADYYASYTSTSYLYFKYGSGADINVKGNNTTIPLGDTQPTLVKYTEFSNTVTGSSFTRSFTIQNTGTANLEVSNITMSGVDSALFVVSGLYYPAVIIPGASINFLVSFSPGTTGLKTATVNIISDDCDEGLYNFAIKANAIAPPSSLGSYPSVTIAAAGGNATVTPSAAPVNTASLTASVSSNFKGIIHVNPATGIVTITNAYPAGNYMVTVGMAGVSTNFLLTVNTNPVCSPALFTNNNDTVPLLFQPESMAVGDFNNDGKQDLAVALTDSDKVAILINNGNGSFTTISNVSVGGFPISLAVGDFNGDGNQDFISSNLAAGSLSVRLGNGAGGFSGNTEYFFGSGPRYIATADFNGDGRLDIAVPLGGRNIVAIRLGDGAGGFYGNTNAIVGAYTESVATGDFNNDGNADLLAANNDGSSVSVRLGDGVGGYTGTTSIPVGTNPFIVSAADFNNDGKLDFAVSNTGSNTVSVRLGDGTGNFTGTTNINIGTKPYWLITGDFNNDGNADFAVITTSGNYDGINKVLLYLGTGTGTFTTGTPLTISYANAVAAGDFNNDGKIDFAITSSFGKRVSLHYNIINNIQVSGNHINIADGSVTPSLNNYTDFGDVSGGLTRTYIIRNYGQANLLISKLQVTGIDSAMFTINGPAIPVTIPADDSVIFTIRFLPTSAGLKTARLNITNNDCSKALYDFAIQGTGVASIVSTSIYASATIATAGSNKIIMPLAAPANAASVTVNTSNNFKGLLQADPSTGAITVTNAYPAGTYPVTVKVSNGFSSATSSFSLVVNNAACSQGRFTTAVNVGSPGGPITAGVGDFNGDGKQDLLIVNQDSNYVAVRLGNGAGSFSGNVRVSAGPQPSTLAISDFNGDGKTDFATVNTDNTVSVRLGDGTGNFTAAPSINSGLDAWTIITADFNGDGNRDLAVVDYGDDKVSIMMGKGNGNFSRDWIIPVGSKPVWIDAGDFNGDGKPDLAVANSAGNNVSIRLGIGNGNFSGTTNIAVGTNPQGLTIADFNSDGKQDMAIANATSNTVSIRLGDGSGNFTGTTNLSTGNSPYSIIAADFNGDGKIDIAAASSLNGTVSIRFGDGMGGFSAVNNVPVVTGIYSIAAGDFNGDGKMDITVPGYSNNYVSIRLGADKEINIRGNNTNISDGDSLPSITNFTDFGAVANGASLLRNFVIQNTGIDTLTVSSITISGSDSALFSMSGLALPVALAPGTSKAFVITFTSSGGGAKNARVNILNNDCDETLYDFAIRGTASCLPSSTTNVWLGNTANWSLVSNWSLGFVPTECTKVVINTSVPFMPEITNSNSSCYSLTLNNGATITVKTGGHLNITANN